MNNLQIVELIKKEYDPKTAFGNKVLIDLIHNIIEPNKKGEFEVNAELETKKIVCYTCPNCGSWHEEEVADSYNFDDIIKLKCHCNKILKITLE